MELEERLLETHEFQGRGFRYASASAFHIGLMGLAHIKPFAPDFHVRRFFVSSGQG